MGIYRPPATTTTPRTATTTLHLQSRDDAITRVRDPEIRELLYSHSGNFTSLQKETSRLQTLISRIDTTLGVDNDYDFQLYDGTLI